jgi:peptidoglycan/LPS O-acetylase OafA/YrhL
VSPILNILRFILALCVVFYHFHGELAGDAGRVAVVGFFLISGFLITLIVNETYPTPAHNWNFLVNRFLRIYPQYVFAALVGLAAILISPESSHALNPVMNVPDGWGEIVPHFTIFGLYLNTARLSPPTWSLNTELYYYLLIGLFTGRSRMLSWAALLILLPLGYLTFLGAIPFFFYGDPVGNGFIFVAGSLAYWYRWEIVRLARRRWVIWALFAFYLFQVFILHRYTSDKKNLVLSTMVLFLLVPMLWSLRLDWLSPAMRQALQIIGHASYPVFLLHWGIGALLVGTVYGGVIPPKGELLTWVVIVTIPVSIAAVYMIDLPVERIRRRFRRQAPPTATVEREAPTPLSLGAAVALSPGAGTPP